MKIKSIIVSLLLLCPLAHAAIARVQYSSCQASATSCATTPITVTAGDWLKIDVVSNANPNPSTITVSDTTGSSPDTITTYSTASSTYATIGMYYVTSANGGSTAVTASTVNTGSIKVVVTEYSGVSGLYSAGSQTLTTTTNESITGASVFEPYGNYISFFNGQEAGQSTPTTTFAPFITLNNGSYNGLITVADFQTNGTYIQNTWNSNDGSNQVAWNGAISLTPTSQPLPTLGSIQTRDCSTGISGGGETTSYSCAYPVNVKGGSALLVTAGATANTDVSNSGIPSISDGEGDVFYLVPMWWVTADVPIGVNFFYCPSAIGGSTTISLTSTASQGWDVWLTELHGASPLRPFVQATRSLFASNTNASTSWGLSLPNESSLYYIYALGGDNADNGGRNALSISPSPPTWTQQSLDQNAIYLQTVWDTTVAGSEGSLTPELTTNNEMRDGNIMALVFSSGAQQAIIPVRQVTNAGTAGTEATSTNKQFVLPVVLGDTLFAVGGCQPSSGSANVSGISDSQGNTWTFQQGSTSTWYGVWTAPVTTAGTDTVTMTCSAGAWPTLNLIDLMGVGAIDQQSNSNSNGSTVSNSITTTNPNDFVIYYLVSQVGSGDITVDSITNGLLLNTSASHVMSGYSFYSSTGAAATYSSEYSNSAGGGSVYVDAGIISFAAPLYSGSVVNGVVAGGVVR